MIKANEIRIGNLYNRKHGKGCTETVIDEMILAEIFGQSLEYSLNIFEPIPLTVSELRKFGFDEYEGFEFIKDGISLHFITTDDNFQFEFTCPELEWKILDVKFVHQLQNLYFNLTGKELIIKS